MSKLKRIRMFAGPNGSGKSTLFKKVSEVVNVGSFVNADIIEESLSKSGLVDVSPFEMNLTEKDFQSFIISSSAKSLIAKASKEGLKIDIAIRENFIVDASKVTHSYEAALISMFLRDALVRDEKSFSFETVLTHPSKLEEIKKAKKNGYRIYLYFVCTDNPLVNMNRVENRVLKGGHKVDKDKIEKRYYSSLQHLYPAMQLAYRSFLFDNSGEEMSLIAEANEDNLILHNSHIPNWVEDYVLSKI